MATLSMADQLTPVEIAKRQKLGEQQAIIEVMKETNELLQDSTLVQASDGTTHRTTQRTSMPTGTKRIYGEGIQGHASTTRQIEDKICMIADFSDVDAKMAEHAPSKEELLRTEDMAFLEGLGQTQVDAFLYDKKEDGPAYLDGFMVRLTTVDNQNVFKMEASGSDMSSILIVKWAPTMAALFYPQGDKGIGIVREFRGKVDATIGITNNRPVILPVYRTWFETNFGLTIRHPKAVKRIGNIKPGTTTGENLALKLIEAMNKLPPGAGNVVIYANSDVKTLLDQYMFTKGNLAMRQEDPWGKEVTIFKQARIRQVDAMLNTEALIS